MEALKVFNFTTVLVFVSFVIFMMLMKAMFFDPIARIRQAREEKAETERNSVASALETVTQLQTHYEDELRKARRQAQEVVVQIQQEAKKTSSQTLDSARQTAREEVDGKLAELARWREDAYQQLSGERQELKQMILRKVTRDAVSTAR